MFATLRAHAGHLVAPLVTRVRRASSGRANRRAHRRDQQSQNSDQREDICVDAVCTDWIRFVHSLQILQSTLRWRNSTVNLRCADCAFFLVPLFWH
jgi:hypothetical protein